MKKQSLFTFFTTFGESGNPYPCLVVLVLLVKSPLQNPFDFLPEVV